MTVVSAIDTPHGAWAIILLGLGQLGQIGAIAAVYVSWLRERRTHLKETHNREIADRNWQRDTLRYEFALREELMRYVKTGAIDMTKIDMEKWPKPPPLPRYNGE